MQDVHRTVTECKKCRVCIEPTVLKCMIYTELQQMTKNAGCAQNCDRVLEKQDVHRTVTMC